MRRHSVLGTAALLAAACGLLLEGAAATPDMAQQSPSPGPSQEGNARDPGTSGGDGPDPDAAAVAPAPPSAASDVPAPPPALDALGRTQAPEEPASAPSPDHAAGVPRWFATTAAALVLLLALVLPGVLLAARRGPVAIVHPVPFRDDGRWKKDWIKWRRN